MCEGGCVYVFVSMRTHVCVHVWRPEVDIWCLSWLLFPLDYETGSLTEARAHKISGTDQQALEPSSLCLPMAGITGLHHHAWIFLYGSGSSNSGLYVYATSRYQQTSPRSITIFASTFCVPSLCPSSRWTSSFNTSLL